MIPPSTSADVSRAILLSILNTLGNSIHVVYTTASNKSYSLPYKLLANPYNSFQLTKVILTHTQMQPIQNATCNIMQAMLNTMYLTTHSLMQATVYTTILPEQ